MVGFFFPLVQDSVQGLELHDYIFFVTCSLPELFRAFHSRDVVEAGRLFIF